MAADNENLEMPPIPEEKPKSKKPKKPKKDSGSSKSEDRNPVKKAKDALDTISGLPSIDVDDLINNLLKNTEDSVVNNVDWKSVYQALSSDEKNAEISETIKHISSLDFISSASHMERINKYKEFIMILKRVPIIKKILRLYTSNILAPDDISKISLKTVPKNPTINKGSEEYISIENKYKVILDKIDLEDRLYDLVFKTLFYGDMFIEILSSKRYLLQTIYNLQIPIKDDKIKITESALDDMYEEITTINMECGFSGRIDPYQINIEWEKPLSTQIQETVDFASTYYFSILNGMGVTENNYDKIKNIGVVKYLNEIFFGNANMFNQKDSFKVFHEDFTQFSSAINNKNIDINTFGSIGSDASKSTTNNDANKKDIESMNKQYSLDYLPVQSTLSSLNIKVHSPDKIIILKDEEIEYGYLYISSGLENIQDMSNGNGSNSGSVIGANSSVSSGAVISSSNFVNQSNVQNNLGMFGNGTSGHVNPTSATNGGGNEAAKLSHSKQISARIAQYIKDKFEEYHGDVNIDNMSPNLQMMIADILNNGSSSITVRYIPPLNMQQFKIEGTGLNTPYGEAVTEDLLFRAKMLLADDINGIINKFTATGKRLVWTVNANTHQQAANRIQQASRAINKKTVGVDDCLDIMASAIFPQDNIFIAKVNGEPQIELSTVDLGEAQADKDNNNYLIKQLITGADIPPAHLGFEEWTSGKNTLATESVVFAQTIIGYQKQFASALTDLIQKIYIAIYSYTNEFNVNFKNLILALNPPRGITLSTYSENISNLQNIVGFMSELEIPKPYIINMFWPELYDEMIDIQRLIDELNKNVKNKSAGDSSGGDSGFDLGGGDAGFDLGGGDTGTVSGDDLSGLVGGDEGGGGGEEPPPA